MTVFTELANEWASPVDAAGHPRQIAPQSMQRWGTEVERIIDAVVSAGTGTIFQSKALLDANLNFPALTMIWVMNDPVPANNGIYQKQGASGSGSWFRVGDLPYSFINATNAGAGTADAIVATSSIPVPAADGGALVTVNVTADNTGAATIAFNGGSALSIISSSGNAMQAGYLTAGMQIAGFKVGSTFRLLSETSTAAMVALVEQAVLDAQTAAAAAQAAQPQAYPVTRAAMAALPDTVVNAYLVEPGFEGLFRQVDATDPALAGLIAADTVSGDIKVSAGNPNLAYLRQRQYGDLIKTSEYGHDLSVALAVAGEQRKRFGPNARVDVLINQTGTIALTKGLQPPTGVNFFSDKRLVLDPTALGIGDMYDSVTGTIVPIGRTVIDVRPLAGTSRAGHYSAALPAFNTIAFGDISVTFLAAHGRKVGDVLVWHDSADGSWFAERPEYKLSMRRRVVGVDGLNVYFDKPARDTFVHSATCKVYVQTIMAGARFGGWHMDLQANTAISSQGVHIFGVDERSEVDNIIALGASYSGVAFAQCLNLRPTRIRGGTRLGTAGASVYPVQIQNCSDVRIRDSEGFGDWHTLAMTGAGGTDVGQTINEDCWFEYCKSFNSGGSAVGSIEMHGNSDRCGFLHCEASEAVLGGRDASLHMGAIDNAQTGITGQGKLVYIGEQHSGRFHIWGTRFRSSKNTGASSNSGTIYCYAGDNQKAEIFLDIEGVRIDAPIEQTPIRIGRGINNNKKFSLSFDGSVNAPTALSLVTVPNTDFGTAVSSYFRIERAAGLAAGVAWADFGGTTKALFTEMKFPRQQVEWTTSGVAAPAEVSPVINWPHAFPIGYAPSVSVQIQRFNLGPRAGSHVYDATRTTVRAEVATGDGTNMGATPTRVTIEGW